MNTKLKVGLILQVPNLLALLVIGYMLVIPYLTLDLLLVGIVGAVVGIVNLTSIICIFAGLCSED